MTHSDVPWHLLPDDPAGFFGLPEPFDRTELRRQYNAMLRQFKPEKHPEEFQKIRGAFEALDSRLRYDQPRPTGPEHALAGGTWPICPEIPPDPGATEDVEDTSEDDIEVPWGPSKIMRTLEAGSPEAAYQALRALPSRLPFHYYALAVLSDVVESASEGETFGEWLLEGLGEHPGEYGLASLFSSYVRETISTTCARTLLRRARVCLTDDFFYYLTETLWLTLARAIPFDEWRALLDELEEHGEQGGRIDLTGRLVFTTRLVRALLFTADEAWIETKLDWLQEHGLALPEWSVPELDALEVLDRYRRSRSAFLNGNPLRERLDRVIRAWAEQDESGADRVFLACQQDFAENRAAVLAAFPPPSPGVEPFILPYTMLARDVAARTLDDPESFLEERVGRKNRDRAHQLLNKLERRTDRSWIGWVWQIGGLVYLALLALSYIVAVSVSFTLVSIEAGSSVNVLATLAGLVGLVAAIASGLFVHFVLRRWLLLPLNQRFSSMMARIAYHRIWRREVVQLMEETHISAFELEQAVAVIEDDRITNDDWLQLMMHEDHGLFLYAVALRFSG